MLKQYYRDFMPSMERLMSQIRIFGAALCLAFMLSLFIGGQVMAQDDNGRFTVVEPAPVQGAAGFGVTMPEKKVQEIWGTESDVFKALPDDLKELVLDEVQVVYNNCARKDLFSKLHDCRCVSIYFLDARLREGPKEDRNVMLEKVGAVCPNPVETAGYIYKECVPMYERTFKKVDQYCACVANEVAVKYGKTPVPKRNYISFLKTDAHVKCAEKAERY